MEPQPRRLPARDHLVTTIDWRGIAVRIADGVQLGPGDRVSVFVTDVAAMDAVEAFVDEGWKRGGVVQVVSTDERFDASALRWASPDVLAQAAPVEAAAMSWSNVHVSFRAMTSPVVDAPADKIAALRRGRGLISTMRWQGTRWALVRVPTPEWSGAMAVDHEELLRQWVASFDADWNVAEERMQRLCDALAGAERAVIEDSWGTLELGLAGRRWVPFAGKANWPDGEIATAPVDDDVFGRIRFPGVFSFAGVRIRDLELTLDAGVIVDEQASEGLEFVREMLATDAGSRRLGELGVGTNAALQTMTGDLLIDEKVTGSVHVAIGRAYPECGGVNESAVHWDIVKDLRGLHGMPPGSLRVDDVWLIRDGVVQPILEHALVATR